MAVFWSRRAHCALPSGVGREQCLETHLDRSSGGGDWQPARHEARRLAVVSSLRPEDERPGGGGGMRVIAGPHRARDHRSRTRHSQTT